MSSSEQIASLPDKNISYSIYLPNFSLCKPMNVMNESVKSYLIHNGHTIVDNAIQADFVILNTCGVVDDEENISVNNYRDILSTIGSRTRIIIIGCLLNINPSSLNIDRSNTVALDNLEHLDSFFKTSLSFKDVPRYADIDKEPANVSARKELGSVFLPLLNNKSLTQLIRKLPVSHKLQVLIDSTVMENISLLEISTGCTENCSYCAIKKAKGSLKSIPLEQILTASHLIKDRPGKAVTLVAQDCGSYGMDIGVSIYDLLVSLKQMMPDLKLNISNLHPKWLVKDTHAWETIFKEFDILDIAISLQSASQQVLGKMNRSYRVSAIKPVLFNIRKTSPKTYFRCHLIVGFPGESLWDYLQNYRVIHWFDLCQVFPYRDRPNTASSLMQNKNRRSVVWLRWEMLSFYAMLVAGAKIIKG